VAPAPETIEVTVGIAGIRIQLAARVGSGSLLSTTVAAFVLMAASCLMMAVASLIGVSALTALIAGLSAPAGIYLLIHVTSHHLRQSGRGITHGADDPPSDRQSAKEIDKGA
jgi:DMSO/TMAO reductase YedYZ heme-binding membrane subunit